MSTLGLECRKFAAQDGFFGSLLALAQMDTKVRHMPCVPGKDVKRRHQTVITWHLFVILIPTIHTH